LQVPQPAFVIDRHRGAVLHGALNVVYADIVPKYGTDVGVLQFDGRSSKTDERGVRQRVVQMPREPVDEIVLAAVRLVGDHDDVAAFREHGVPVALLLGEELVDRGKYNAARGHRQEVAEMRSAFRLHWWLAQQVTDRENVPKS